MFKKSWLLCLLLPALLLLTGCADGNSEAPLGVHPDGWFVDHRATVDINECGSCHGVDLEGSGAAPSCFSATFDGRRCHANGPGQAPHPVDGSYLSAANHGPAAKGQTAAFPNGMLDCQPCHAQTGTDNPRFNVGINAVGGNGCESCHPANAAHPANWYDVGSKHSDIAVADLTAMCVLCHDSAAGGPASGGVGPACSSCHPADPLANASGCASCHNLPPDGLAPVGSLSPNQAGSHTLDDHSEFIGTCSNCHEGFGFNTADHFDATMPASVEISNTFDADGADSATYDPGTGNCTNVSCHGGAGNVEGPW